MGPVSLTFLHKIKVKPFYMIVITMCICGNVFAPNLYLFGPYLVQISCRGRGIYS